MGQYYSLFVYLFFSLTLLVFIITLTINSQKFFTRLVGATIIKKINGHKCYFSQDDDL
jgi:hypothetical protein